MTSTPTIARTAAFDIPSEDAAEFARLPEATRARVRWFLSVMRSIAGAKSKTKACAEIATAAKCHFNSIYQPWNKYQKTRDWRVLIDRRKTSEFWQRDPSKKIGLPHEFLQHWKTLVEDNDRASKPAHAQLIRDWRAWSHGDLTKRIPGYTTPPAAAPGSAVPRGWTYSNLLNHLPTDIELAAARKGRTAAKKLLPGIITTRVGSYPFAEIQFDDMWHAFLVNVPGQAKPCHLLEFGAIDHYTTYLFQPGLKPRIRDTDTGKMKQLNSRDFHLFLVNWLLDYGIHPHGTTLNVENGTAAISRAFEQKLELWFPGRVTVKRSGMSGAPAYSGAWHERAKGNPNAKALKEGIGKLIQGALAHIPGQIGMNRDDAPATLTGRTRENDTLLAIASQVPALREKLQLGFLDLHEAVFAVNNIYQALNCRIDHAIEGWDEAGLTIEEFRPSRLIEDWMPLHAAHQLPDHERALMASAFALDPTLRRRRRLSPAEALLAQGEQLIKPPLEAVPDLLGPEHGITKPVVNGTINLTSPGLGKLRYFAAYQDAGGFIRRIPNGTEILAHLNPWKPEQIYLTQPATGRFLGLAQRDTAITRGDVEAIERAHGRAERQYKDSVAEVVARHGLARIPSLKHNTRVLREAAAPTARERALAAAPFDTATMLETEDETEFATHADPTIAFDPADLL